MDSTSKQVGFFVEKKKEFMNFLKTRFNVFHESNVFFRDLHYGVMAFLQTNGLPYSYSPTEELTKEVIASYEGLKIFIRIDDRSWMINYLPFKKPPVKAAAPAKQPAASQTRPGATVSATATTAAAQQNAARSVEVSGGIAG